MATSRKRILTEADYEEAAQAYLRSLPLEHFMEGTPQATQREITLESLALVRAIRPEVHVFNELLVQYPLSGSKKIGQVVPDNMIVIHPAPITAQGHFNISLEEAKPFCVLEYVSLSNKRKDYEDNMEKYQRDLKVPYYLRFYPDTEDLSLFRYQKKRYVTVEPNEHDRLEIPELELGVALLDSWMRFWYQGKLLPLPGELQRDLKETRQRLAQAQTERDKAQTERDKAQTERDKAQTERDKAQTERDKAQTERDRERQNRIALEEELARLRAQLGK